MSCAKEISDVKRHQLLFQAEKAPIWWKQHKSWEISSNICFNNHCMHFLFSNSNPWFLAETALRCRRTLKKKKTVSTFHSLGRHLKVLWFSNTIKHFSSSLASRLSNVCDWSLITFFRKLCVNVSVLMSQKARITIRQTCGTKAGDENVDEPLFSYYIYWRHAFLQVISKFTSAKQKIYIKVSWGFCHFISIFSQQIFVVWVTPEFSFSDCHS